MNGLPPRPEAYSESRGGEGHEATRFPAFSGFAPSPALGEGTVEMRHGCLSRNRQTRYSFHLERAFAAARAQRTNGCVPGGDTPASDMLGAATL